MHILCPRCNARGKKECKVILRNQTLNLSSSQCNDVASSKLGREIRVQDIEEVSEMAEDSKENKPRTQGSRELNSLVSVLLYRWWEEGRCRGHQWRCCLKETASWPGVWNPTTPLCGSHPTLLQVLVVQEQKGTMPSFKLCFVIIEPWLEDREREAVTKAKTESSYADAELTSVWLHCNQRP